MIRLVVRLGVALVANAVGILVAAYVLDGVGLNATGFVIDVVLYTVAFAVSLPFFASLLRRGRSKALGGVALIATLASLIITTVVTDGLTISGIGTWFAAAAIVWAASLLAGFVLPFLGLRKFLETQRPR